MAGLLAVIVWTMRRWFFGGSADTRSIDDRATISDPDLRPAVIEYALDEAAAQVVSYGLTPNEYRAARARLGLAVRARRGERLTDMELGVLLGVISPPASVKSTREKNGQDVLPVLWSDETT
jgi:hypothetical protein